MTVQSATAIMTQCADSPNADFEVQLHGGDQAQIGVQATDRHTQRCYLGLGSNLTNQLGTPQQHIRGAIDALAAHAHISHVRSSSLYTSKPMGPQDQPDFVNAVVEIDTCLTPVELLALCQQLEQQARRVRLRRWGERSLDVDILLYADWCVDTPDLRIPHAGIGERNFVLVPLAELNPKLHIHDIPITDYPMSHDWSGLLKLT